MKKTILLGAVACVALAFTSCKSSESAYKKAYEKAKASELAESNNTAATNNTVTTVPTTTVAPVTYTDANVNARQEKVELVSGTGLKAYSVVCGSFGVKANADGLKTTLDNDGYDAKVVYNAERGMYRVVVQTFDSKVEAAHARDAFKAKYPNRTDFQGSWLLYNGN